ncbi:MAG: hypothetical protein FJY80_09240 [Candidatus Aminicenantes bacterium]|nr:hypothetical protein [Candidatus Aminicenantes bacterium]
MRRLVLAAAFAALLGSGLRAENVTPIRSNGPSSNRIDIVILGDGYTSAEMSKFASDAEAFTAGLLGQEPFREYEAYFNVFRVDVVSSESGADHPARGVYKNTALDAAYDCSGITRLICVNTTKVNEVLNRSLPAAQRELVIVLVNDPEYGGSGGSVAVSSTHAAGVEIVLHEVGHSFGLLADEYDSSPPACNNTVEPSQANVTRETNRALIKWNTGGGPPTGWIEPSQPVPTPILTPGVGLFQGAKYCTAGLYRPTTNSKMRSLGRPFEEVNVEQVIKRIYNVVLPVDAWTPEESTVRVARGGVASFTATVMAPRTYSIEMEWFVNGAFAGRGGRLEVDTAGLGEGTHRVEARGRDQTPAVRSDPQKVLERPMAWSLVVFSPIYAPLDFSGRKVLNRSLLRGEYINLLTWKANPQNGNIGGYNLYRDEGAARILLSRLGAGTFEYRHRGVGRDSQMTYRLTAVGPDGMEGAPAMLTVK